MTPCTASEQEDAFAVDEFTSRVHKHPSVCVCRSAVHFAAVYEKTPVTADHNFWKRDIG